MKSLSPAGALPHILPMRRTFAVELLLGAVGLLALTLAAQVKVYTPISEVPFTLQSLVVLGIALVLGAPTGPVTVAAYAGLGLIGLPLFAGWSGGLSMLGAPSYGYILGFALAAAVIAPFARAEVVRSPLKTGALVLAGEAIIFATGFCWLMLTMGVNAPAALWKGVIVFLPWEMVKLAILAVALPGFCELSDRLRGGADFEYR